MASRKTWLWIVVVVLGTGLVSLIALAGAGMYFVSHHIQTGRSTSADALRAFEAVKATFHQQRPLYELDSAERPTATRPISELPTAKSAPESLWVLAWDPDEQRLVKISLPLWMLRFGRQKLGVGKDEAFDLERLNLDPGELRRIGPALLFDVRSHQGVHVLLWTQ